MRKIEQEVEGWVRVGKRMLSCVGLMGSGNRT